jgi:hypothetical protein
MVSTLKNACPMNAKNQSYTVKQYSLSNRIKIRFTKILRFFWILRDIVYEIETSCIVQE